MFRIWWQSIAPIELQAIAALFREFELDYTQLATLVISWMQIEGEWVLSLDRTTWKFGTQWYNI